MVLIADFLPYINSEKLKYGENIPIEVGDIGKKISHCQFSELRQQNILLPPSLFHLEKDRAKPVVRDNVPVTESPNIYSDEVFITQGKSVGHLMKNYLPTVDEYLMDMNRGEDTSFFVLNAGNKKISCCYRYLGNSVGDENLGIKSHVESNSPGFITGLYRVLFSGGDIKQIIHSGLGEMGAFMEVAKNQKETVRLMGRVGKDYRLHVDVVRFDPENTFAFSLEESPL